MEARDYRKLCSANDLTYYNVTIEQTDLMIATERDMSEEAYSFIYEQRKVLLEYIAANPFFEKSLVPMECTDNSPLIIKRMCLASQKAHVGPMAGVAGGLSQMLCEYLSDFTGEIIIENGGDNCILTKKGRVARIFAGEGAAGFNIEIPPAKEIYAVCTSSGTFGHSLSFGKADSVSIISDDAFLADSAATAICNSVHKPEDIPGALDKALAIGGVRGVIIVCGKKIGAAGEVKFVK